MATAEPQHVGDVALECQVCGEHIAVPVTCETVPGRRGRGVAIRCTPDLSPVVDHLADVHGVALSPAA